LHAKHSLSVRYLRLPKALIFRALTHSFAGAVCLTPHG